MRNLIFASAGLLLIAGIVTATTHPAFEQVKAQIEAQYVPHLVIELTDDAAADLRSARSLPESLRAMLPTATYQPLFTYPFKAEYENAWYANHLNRWFLVDGVDVPSLRATGLESLQAAPEVVRAQFSSLNFADLTPADNGNFNMWGLDAMHLSQAWNLQIGNDEVVVSTIDTGCEISHPDLQNNIHINPGEDLNGNGAWDASDVNGVDDDINGFVDDLAGWDFVSATVSPIFQAPGEEYGPRDNRVWPDIVGHGTHTSGTSASATNNSTGVPSASWNVSNMPLRAGYAYRLLIIIIGVGDTVDFVAATQYAAENGTDIISISFGGTAYEQFYQDAINYARALGVLMFASAGNSNNQTINYPAGYNNVVSVAATDVGDVKAGFSSYGAWVDVCAPGVNIWSTVPGPSYASYDGTSMASPNAAAVAALVKSFNPFMSPAALEQLIINGCDNIDGINPGYAGLLGAGRVNAFTSLQLAVANFPAPPYPNVDIIPLIAPVQIPAGGGSFPFNVAISNNTGGVFTFDAWLSAVLPNGANYGPILSQQNIVIAAGQTMMFTLQQTVPGAAPAGVYQFLANIGLLNNTTWESDLLHFSKTGPSPDDRDGSWPSTGWPVVSGEPGDSPALPLLYTVGRAYPNPFNPTTTLSLQLPETALLSIGVFDLLGRRVAEIADGQYASGEHRFVIDASSFPSGVYFVATSVPGHLRDVQKIMLVK